MNLTELMAWACDPDSATAYIAGSTPTSAFERTVKTVNTYNPDYIGPPGETIAELMDDRGVSMPYLAQETGLSQDSLFQIMTGVLPIDNESASFLEESFGVPAAFWMERSRIHREFWHNKPEWNQHILEMQSEFTRFRPSPPAIGKPIEIRGDEQIPFFSES